MNEELGELLKELNFTQYEAQTLETLVRYHILSASELHKYSKVPQPKIYETMIKLERKGFIDIIAIGSKSKRYYKIKPSEILEEKILKYTKEIQDVGQKSIKIINKIHSTEESEDIPFIGIAKEENLMEHLYYLIDNAKVSLDIFLPLNYFNDQIVRRLNERNKDLSIKIISSDDHSSSILRKKMPKIAIYQLKTPAFEIFSNMLNNISKFAQLGITSPYILQIFKEIATNLKNMFGLMIIDDKKSFFRIPLPIDIPIAMMTILPKIVEFHKRGMNELLTSTVKL